MKSSYFSERDFRKNRVIALVAGLLLHITLTVGIFFLMERRHGGEPVQSPDELNFGSSGGGGAENANEGQVEFGPQQATQEDPQERKLKSVEVELIEIHVIEPDVRVENAVPVPEKPPEKPKIVEKKKKPKPSIIASQLPIGHVRHAGQGPGSGGGMGGGSGGGIGAHIGYSIDWGGTGSRRLLSGRIPKYPEGTDKEMTVVLSFSVLPDGSVSKIAPKRKTDEILERSAIIALQTWRFEPLPNQVKQSPQPGEASFKYTHE